MTTNDLLTASDEDLPRVLGEVLQKEHEYLGSFQNCVHCKCSRHAMSSLGICKHPIPLTPANAFKWRDWAVEKFGECVFKFAMQTVTVSDFNWSHVKIISLAQPKHYLIAAAVCELNAKELSDE